VCTVKNSRWWTDELSETCRVSFQNKSEKLLHLVAFVIWICHDAQSHERKISAKNFFVDMGSDMTSQVCYKVY
jgi:hypothetical protein